MKKSALLIILTFLCIVTGCGKNKKVLCTIDKEFNSGYRLEAKVTGNIKNDNVSGATLKMTMNFNDARLAESTYQVLMEDKDKMEIKLDKNIITITEKVEQPDNQSKQAFIEAYEAEGYTCK